MTRDQLIEQLIELGFVDENYTDNYNNNVYKINNYDYVPRQSKLESIFKDTLTFHYKAIGGWSFMQNNSEKIYHRKPLGNWMEIDQSLDLASILLLYR